jgi:2-oxoglutarate ferredoxin oxidoreductase subunit gamma
MHEEITLGGFGGQGVLFIGRLLAEAAFREGHEVVCMPSYGAEKRGGTVWCDVTVSEEAIGALFITRPTAAVAMNPASLSKLETMIKPGGQLVVNRSLVPDKVKRADICTVYVPANDMAAELGDDSVSNMVILGALLAVCPVVAASSITAVMGELLAGKQARLALNEKDLDAGYDWTKKSLASPESKFEEGAHVQ